MPRGTNETIDKTILAKIKLTDAEVRSMEKRFWGFAKRMDEAQVRALRRSLPTAEQAVTTLGGGVTAAELEQFFRERSPRDASMFVVNFGGGKKGKGGKH
jgi:hypothetical protein